MDIIYAKRQKSWKRFIWDKRINKARIKGLYITIWRINMSELVSIVVPVYGVEKWIRKCVSSILQQDYENIELLLIDDGSPDGSGKICDEYASKYKNVTTIHKVNGGVSSARNVGIKNAKGKYLLFVDGDDWIEADAVSKIIDFMRKHNFELCITDKYYKDSIMIKTEFPYDKKENCISVNEALHFHLLHRLQASSCLACYNLETVRKIGFDERIHTYEDWEYLFRVIQSVKTIGIISDAWYHYRTVMGSASKSELNKRKMSCLLIPQKVRLCLKNQGRKDLFKYAEGLEAVFIYHLMVISANSKANSEVAEDEREIQKIARNRLLTILQNKYLLKRLKLYSVMVAVHPVIFRICYKMKKRISEARYQV